MRSRRFNPAGSSSVLVIALVLAGLAFAQQPQPTSEASPAPPPSPTAPATVPVAPLILTSIEQSADAPPVTEDELRQQLQGKTFYLRGGYLDNPLRFDETGRLSSNSPQASFTLSLIEIQRVHLERHRVEIEAVRYGLHFLGALATEDQTAAVDKVRLTSKKKPLVITIDREQLVKARKEKEKAEKKRGPQTLSNANQPPPSATPLASSPQPEAEPNRRGAPVTSSQAHANRALVQALDRVFASGIDDRLIATLPDYWSLFYKSVAAHQAFRPADPATLRQGDVDQKAKLISALQPASNDYAQNNGVAGVAMYHVVVGADGKPQEIAVGRPIGFGLDENAVKTIREAKFQPAVKGGNPVPVELDLLVQFRIYSKRTAEASSLPIPTSPQPPAPTLPGPYSVNLPRPDAQPQ